MVTEISKQFSSAQWNKEHSDVGGSVRFHIFTRKNWEHIWQMDGSHGPKIHDESMIYLWIQDVACNHFFEGNPMTPICAAGRSPPGTAGFSNETERQITGSRWRKHCFFGVWMGTVIPQIGILNDSHIIYNIYIYILRFDVVGGFNHLEKY
jgi:hypothetical protein